MNVNLGSMGCADEAMLLLLQCPHDDTNYSVESRSTTRCQCDGEHREEKWQSSLMLYHIEELGNCTIQELVDVNISEHQFEQQEKANWHREGCELKGGGVIESSVKLTEETQLTPADWLFLQIQREEFNSSEEQIVRKEQLVDVRENLKVGKKEYQLTSMMVHEQKGHYVSVTCNNNDGFWIIHNDSSESHPISFKIMMNWVRRRKGVMTTLVYKVMDQLFSDLNNMPWIEDEVVQNIVKPVDDLEVFEAPGNNFFN